MQKLPHNLFTLVLLKTYTRLYRPSYKSSSSRSWPRCHSDLLATISYLHLCQGLCAESRSLI